MSNEFDAEFSNTPPIKTQPSGMSGDLEAEFETASPAIRPGSQPERVIEAGPDDLEEIIKHVFGMSSADVKNRLEFAGTLETAMAEDAAAREFVETHPDYVPTQKNYDLIQRTLAANNLEFNSQNISQVFEFLKKQGQLETQAPARTRPAAAPQKVVQTGISQSLNSPAAPSSSADEEADFVKAVQAEPDFQKARDMMVARMYAERQRRGLGDTR